MTSNIITRATDPEFLDRITNRFDGVPDRRRGGQRLADFYKFFHRNGIPKNIGGAYSYYESRKGSKFPYTVFIGLQAVLLKHVVGERITIESVRYQKAFIEKMTGNTIEFDSSSLERLVNDHGGRWPVTITAVPEGSVIPTGNILWDIQLTVPDPEFAWVPSFLETMLSWGWHTYNVGTISFDVRLMFERYAELMGCPIEEVIWKLHCFGMRGATGLEAAQQGGPHLASFSGTDTNVSIEFWEDFYDLDFLSSTDFLVGSIPASEHFIATIQGKAREDEQTQYLLNQFKSGGLALVGDSYSIHRFVDQIGTRFKHQILSRDGFLVVRPDSGNIVQMVFDVLSGLWDHFGGYETTGLAGAFRVLDDHVRTIQGDGCEHMHNDGTIKAVLDMMMKERFSIQNAGFGMGGGLLQKHDRDTQRVSTKGAAVIRDGVWVDQWKDPLHGNKTSKRGRMKLIRVGGDYRTVKIDEFPEYPDIKVPVVVNGELTRFYRYPAVFDNVAKARTEWSHVYSHITGAV